MCNSRSVHVCSGSKKPADTIEAKVAEQKGIRRSSNKGHRVDQNAAAKDTDGTTGSS